MWTSDVPLFSSTWLLEVVMSKRSEELASYTCEEMVLNEIVAEQFACYRRLQIEATRGLQLNFEDCDVLINLLCWRRLTAYGFTSS